MGIILYNLYIIVNYLILIGDDVIPNVEHILRLGMYTYIYIYSMNIPMHSMYYIICTT